MPFALADTHLALVRSFEILATTISGFAETSEDPLQTLVAIRLYRDASASLLRAVETVRSALVAESGVPEQGTPEYLFVVIGVDNL